MEAALASAATYQWFRAREGGVCLCERRFWGVCVEGGKVLFEEIPQQLKILLGGSNKAGLLKFWIKGEQIFLRLRRMQRRE